jgi:cell division transport system permease protein
MIRWADQHLRTLAAVLAKLARTPFATLLNVVVIGVALALPAGLYIALTNLQSAVRTATPQPQLTLFLDLDASRTEVRNIEARLQKHDDVAAARYVPRDQALEDLKRASGMGGIADALERNPLPDAFIVDPRDGSAPALERLRLDLAAWPKVARVQVDTEWAQRLDALLKLGRAALLLLATVLGFALVAITFNTIRLQILVQRDEIEVASLIGATDTFVRRPFLYYGALLGLLGGLAAWAFLVVAVEVLNGALTELSYLYGSRWELRSLTPEDAVSLLLFAAALGCLGAWLSVARHLATARPR